MRPSRSGLVICAVVAASTAFAADADNGRRIAQARCVTCHAVGTERGREIADAPPFEIVARKFVLNPEILAFSMLDPHPRMNVTMTRSEAQDLAAYINTLAR